MMMGRGFPAVGEKRRSGGGQKCLCERRILTVVGCKAENGNPRDEFHWFGQVKKFHGDADVCSRTKGIF